MKDRVGFTSVVTGSTGNIVGEQRYYPFGETRLATGTLYTDKLFTGQRNIAGLGIYHYQSRFYSPKLGRFLSADSLVPNPFNPQDYNRFAYVRNNPVRYTDPSGHRACVTQEECADMGTTPNGGTPSKPRPQLCTRNCGGADKPKGEGGGGDPVVPVVSLQSVVQSGSCSGPSCPIIPVVPAGPSSGGPLVTVPVGSTTSSYSYCGNGPNSLYNLSDCGATVTQDLALLIDAPFAGAEAIALPIGCLAGPEGCAAVVAASDALFNITGANAAETILSTYVSTGFSIISDYSYDGRLGEGTATAMSAAVVGFLSPDPMLDFVIDGYGAGYNHDIFNGIFSFFNSDPIFSP